MMDAVENLTSGSIDKESLGELDATMTAVEGYAELVMDEAFDDEYADLRRKLDQRRQGRSPFEQLIRRLLGLSVKRRQYERGKEFFDEVVQARDIETAGRVWESPEMLPTDAEFDDPQAWLARVDR
jgi:putative hydrolase